MQTFILNRTKVLNDKTLKAVEQTFHDTLADAEAKFHRNIASDITDENLFGSISIITDTLGNKHDAYTWDRDDL